MLLLFAVGVPKVLPDVSPRRVMRVGFLALFTGLVLLVALLDYGAGPEIITWPLLLAGAGIGSIASQLGSVTVAAVPDEQSGEVGGLQNTAHSSGRRSAPHWPVPCSSRAGRVVPDRDPEQPGSSRQRRIPGGDEARRRSDVHVQRRPRSGA